MRKLFLITAIIFSEILLLAQDVSFKFGKYESFKYNIAAEIKESVKESTSNGTIVIRKEMVEIIHENTYNWYKIIERENKENSQNLDLLDIENDQEYHLRWSNNDPTIVLMKKTNNNYIPTVVFFHESLAMSKIYIGGYSTGNKLDKVKGGSKSIKTTYAGVSGTAYLHVDHNNIIYSISFIPNDNSSIDIKQLRELLYKKYKLMFKQVDGAEWTANYSLYNVYSIWVSGFTSITIEDRDLKKKLEEFKTNKIYNDI